MLGVPENLRSDNGPEFVAKELQAWLVKIGVTTRYVSKRVGPKARSSSR
jgi:putative transposase